MPTLVSPDCWQRRSIGPIIPGAPMPLASGYQLGPYQIVTAIGAGGMGEVYRARDTMLRRDVAIKVLQDSIRDI